jgi:DNA-binding LytR/AlgR family response regulator
MKNYRVLAVEDDPLFVIHLEQHLEEMQHELVGITDNSDEVYGMVAELNPDLILMDISIKGSLDGVALATKLREEFDTPIIFLTANNDIKIYQETKNLLNTLHLIKPFDRITLDSSIESLLKLYIRKQPTPEETVEQWDEEAFFVKIDSKRIKLTIADILFIQADGNYCYLNTLTSKRFAIKSSLKKMMGKLPPNFFEQIHRRYLVQFEKIESLDLRKSEVTVSGIVLPLGGQYKDGLQSRMNLI